MGTETVTPRYDLRETISDTLRRHKKKPTPQLVDDIYELVITEASDVNVRVLQAKIDRMVDAVVAQTKK